MAVALPEGTADDEALNNAQIGAKAQGLCFAPYHRPIHQAKRSSVRHHCEAGSLIRSTGLAGCRAGPETQGFKSRLVDHLASEGYEDLTVLDLSAAALTAAKTRISEKAQQVHWLAADATTWEPSRAYDVWHDRAAFHFLTSADDQAAYVLRLHRALRRGGHVIIGTFALEGPEKCSGLPVARHDAESLGKALGAEFALIDTRRHEHPTPWGGAQRFQFSTFRRGA